MKKLLMTAAAVFAFGFANAQDGQFKIGAHVGLPMGDFKESYSLNLGVDASYLWNITDEFKAGGTTGFSMFMGKTQKMQVLGNTIEIKSENAGYIPLAATGQYNLSDDLFVGADLGYAISTNGGDGGLLYQPKFGFQTEKTEIFLGYKGISANGATISTLNLGFALKI